VTGVVIETVRLRLRAYREDERADMVALAGNWQVACGLSNLPHPYAEADADFWIAQVRQDHATERPRSFAIALRESNRPIGGGGLDGSFGVGSGAPARGCWLGQPFWRHGCAREAVAAIIGHGFRVLERHEIRAPTNAANAASQRVLLACGLLACGLRAMGEIARQTPTRTGTLRASWFRLARRDLTWRLAPARVPWRTGTKAAMTLASKSWIAAAPTMPTKGAPNFPSRPA
jgi:RimJ/RimL family protein N-acetyltransferase